MPFKFAPVFLLFLAGQLFAQSPKTVLIEHFTNTKCSICASRNPGFYATLDSYPQVLHIAFHPSSPYPSCYFSQQNVTENDDRTKLYNIFGSTPKIAVNGWDLAPANPLITPAAIEAELNQTSPIEVSATEELIAADSIKSRVVVRTTGNVSVSRLLFFAGVVQDTVQYSAGNGEQLHHDVFRKALTKAKGDTIDVPALNDSFVVTYTYKVKPGWREPNLATMAWVQIIDHKQVLNAIKSHRVVNVPSGIDEVVTTTFSIYPNPLTDKLTITGIELDERMNYSIFDLAGRKILEQPLYKKEIDVSGLAKGVYFLRINTTVKKFVKE